MQAALNQIKVDIENAIRQNGEGGKNALIRSQKPIKLIHNALKTDLCNQNIHPSLINPHSTHIKRLLNLSNNPNRVYRLKQSELKLAGYLKTKNQDISVIPNNLNLSPVVLSYPTMLNGYEDRFGDIFTESILSINIRSQLSSTDKNFDTLYERTFAESFNLHKRCPNMVLGELYMIIAREYDEGSTRNRRINFRSADNIEKYIRAFQAINDRQNSADEYWKYERCCLLVVDFSESRPKIYNTDSELKAGGLIPTNSNTSIQRLNYSNFITDLMNVHSSRFPAITFS